MRSKARSAKQRQQLPNEASNDFALKEMLTALFIANAETQTMAKAASMMSVATMRMGLNICLSCLPNYSPRMSNCEYQDTLSLHLRAAQPRPKDSRRVKSQCLPD